MTTKRRRGEPVVANPVANTVASTVANEEDEEALIAYEEEERAAKAAVRFEDMTTDEKIADLKSRFGTDEKGVVRISRRKVDGTIAYQGSIPVDTFDEEIVARKFGGGVFYCRFMKGRKDEGSITLVVDESVKPDATVEVLPHSTVPVTVSRETPDDLPSMRRELDFLRGKLEGLGEKTEKGDALASITAAVSLIKSLQGDTGPKQIKEWLELAQSMLPERAEATSEGFPWARLLDRIEPLVSLAVEQGRSGAQLTPTPVGPKPIAPALPNPPVPGATVPIWQRIVAQEIPHLLDHAQKNHDPALQAGVYAENLEDKLPITMYTQLVEMAKAATVDDIWTQAVTVFPQIGAQEKWLKEFLTELRAILVDEGEEEEEAIEQPKAEGL